MYLYLFLKTASHLFVVLNTHDAVVAFSTMLNCRVISLSSHFKLTDKFFIDMQSLLRNRYMPTFRQGVLAR